MPEQYPYFPQFSTYLPPFDPNEPVLPARPVLREVPATGTGNWLTSGLGAGFHGAVSEVGRALQAGAQLFGASDTAKSLADFAERAHEREQSYARPDLEESPWSPAGIAYNLARMVPMGVVTAGGALAGAATAPVSATGAAGAVAATGLRAFLASQAGRAGIGASLSMFPTSVGANVQREITETGELTHPGKALALGVPEAIAQGVLPARMEALFGKGILRGLGHAAATQGIAGGATEGLTQLMGDPNREFTDRASAITHSALTGAALGTIAHGAFSGVRALVGKPAQDVLNDPKALADATDQALAPAPAVPAVSLEQLQLPLPRVPDQSIRELPLFAPREPVPAASVAPAAPVPVLDFTAPLTGKAFKEGMAQVAAAPPEAQAAVKQQLVDAIVARGVDKPLTSGLKKWGEAFDVLTEKGALREEFIPGQLPLPLPRVPEGLKDLPLFAPREPAPAPAATPVAPAVPALEVPLDQQMREAGVSPRRPGEPLQTATREEIDARMQAAGVSPAAAPEPAAPAAPVPVLDFTKGAVKAGAALYKAATPEVQAAMRQPLMDLIIARAGEGKEPTKLQERWANELDIWGHLEKAVPKAEETRVEVPPGVAPEAPPTPPAAPEVPAAATPDYLGIPDFLRREKPKVIETADDRAAALNGVAAQIAKLPDSEIKKQHLVEELKTVTDLLPKAERNSGLVDRLNARTESLRAAVEAAAQRPADAVAAPDLAPSPRAEARLAPTGDLGDRLEKAQSALSGLKQVLGNRPEVLAAIKSHADFQAEVNRAVGPEELRAALAKDPELDPDADNLGTLGQISKSQQKEIRKYLTTQHEAVLQGLRDNSDSRARVVTSRDGLPVTQLDADVADLHQRGVPLADVADHIIEHTPDPETAEIVAKLKPFLPKDAKTVFRDGVTDKEGEYFTRQKTSALYNAADATTTSIHEMVHAVTHRALEGDSAAARTMRGIYDQLKDKGDHAGITDAHEMVAEAYANPIYRDFLKSRIVKGTSLWDRLVDTVRSVIGLEPRLFNAFDRIMSHGDDLLKEQRTYPNSEWMGPDSYALVANKATGTGAAAADEGGASIREKIADNSLNVRAFLRKAKGWSPGQWLARNPEYNKLSKNIQEYVNSLAAEDPRKKQIGKAAIVANRQSSALPAEGKEVLNQLLAATTSYGFHPDQGITQYVDDIKDNPTRMGQFKAVENLWNQAGKIPGVREAFNTWRSTMSMLGHATAVHNLQSVERGIDRLATLDKWIAERGASALPEEREAITKARSVLARDSFREFDGRDDLTNQPKLSADYWQKELNDRVAANKEVTKLLSADKLVVDAKLDAIKLKKDQPKELLEKSSELESQIDQLGAAIKLAENEQKRMLKEPYFHLGRKGDYFITGKLVTKPGEIDEETGKQKLIVDQDVLSKFVDHLQKNGVNDVAVMQGNQHGTFYTRVETPAQLGALYRVLGDAQKAGLLSTDDPLARGKIFDPHIFNRVASQATQDIIERLRAKLPVAPVGADKSLQPELDKAHYASIQDLQRTLLSMTPETSMNRLMAHRQNVQGFSKDMLQSQRYAADVSAFSLARRSLSHEVSAAEAGMLKDVEKANGDAAVDTNTALGLADTVAELMRGQRLRQTYVPKDWRDLARSFTNFLHIGMSTAYFPMQLSSLALTGAPELAKLHGSGLSGYGPAFMAMQRAVSPTMKALAAIAKSPEGLTAGVTREGLDKSTLTPAQKKTILGMELRGALGSYTASTSEHPALTGTALKAANTLGMFSDLTPRLIMGLAADELYTAKPHPTLTREQFIDRAIGDSQGYYSTALGARQMGRGGFLGSYTPMTMQFQTWNINLANKLYREVYDAVRGEDAQTKKDARTWLAGHAAAVTMLSGTLGLPAVAVAASVYDKLADWFTNRDDHDITASYRGFLADHFGKDMGEIIARGLPRAAGVDFANWGEGEVLPGSASLKIFTEKRKWEDVEKDWFKSMAGPAADQVLQLGLAARDIMNGDYLEGLGRFAPGLISGPMKAYKLSSQGDFVDQHGQKLPISSPNAAQIMLTALGLKPAKLAEYQEVTREESGLRAMREQSSANISQHLRTAWTQGDQGSFNAWMAAAQKWQLEHPGMVPPQVSFARALQTHQNQLAQARAAGLPIGVQPRDISGRGMLQYGNIPMQ